MPRLQLSKADAVFFWHNRSFSFPVEYLLYFLTGRCAFADWIFFCNFALNCILIFIMARYIKIKRGLDIPRAGIASGRIEIIEPDLVGITPDDFEGHNWKCCVKEGEELAAGTPLFFDKETENIKIVSPVSGKVKEIKRGERRKILYISIVPDKNSAQLPQYDIKEEKDKIRKTLQQSGLWAFMRQRPFDIVPDSDAVPRDIFVTAFDSSPLAQNLFDKDDVPYIEKGLEVLNMLSGKITYIATKANSDVEFKNGENLKMDGPHPSGNVGVQIASTTPVNKGETVFTLDVTTLIRIGKLYTDGVPTWKTIVALTGPEMPDPHLVETVIGIDIRQLIPAEIANDQAIRIISGNVLTGKKVKVSNEFLRFPYRQITAIAEGGTADEFMGWASMSPNKFSIKRTFPAFLKGLSKPFPFDARIKGGKRAMILSGEFDKVFPFDIYPEYLLRAINAKDIDRMEKLGIYEVAPEDFALPEFVDTSKQELQQMVRDSLNYLRSEL